MKYHDMKSIKRRKLTNEEKLNKKGIPSFRQMCSEKMIAPIREQVKRA